MSNINKITSLTILRKIRSCVKFYNSREAYLEDCRKSCDNFGVPYIESEILLDIQDECLRFAGYLNYSINEIDSRINFVLEKYY